MGQRLTWSQICCSEQLQGLWVALDGCRFDAHDASHPVEGELVDADADLHELCRRVRGASRAHYTIVFCDEAARQATGSTVAGGEQVPGSVSSPTRGTVAARQGFWSALR